MTNTPSDNHKSLRKPMAFDPPNEPAKGASKNSTKTKNTHAPRQAQSIDPDDENIIFTDKSYDMFDQFDAQNFDDEQTAEQPTTGFPFLKLFMAAFGLLLSLSIGLWVDSLISAMFMRNAWLGVLTLSLSVIALGALTALIVREIIGLSQLRSVADLRREITRLSEQNQRHNKHAKQLVNNVIRFVAHRPETAKGRRALKDMEEEIIDGADYLVLAERELMQKLDEAAQTLIIKSAKRVSVVTAISPRALLDVSYVLYEMIRLSRQIAQLYGARPGFLGTWALLKSMVAHLAITGGMAVGEDMLHQLVGQTVVSKFSARFGEGMVNGLMTSRVGIVAMVVARPMPFNALDRPSLGTLIGKIRDFK